MRLIGNYPPFSVFKGDRGVAKGVMNLLRATSEFSGEGVVMAVQGERRSESELRKSRILMVGMDLERTRGGITTLTRDILGSAVADRFDIEYISSQAEDLGLFGKAAHAATALIRFVWKCLTKAPDIIYVHVGSNASLYRESVFILLAKLLRKRVIGHFHAGDVREYLALQPKAGRSFICHGLSCCDRWIAVSQESSDTLRSISKSRNVSVIPNGIRTAAFNRKTRGSEDGIPRLLFVGAVGKLKGESDLVKALSEVKNRGIDFRVSFAGYGAERLCAELELHGLIDLVEHLGPVATDERVIHFHRADIFVLPTYAEAMPVSVIEAMASGLAIVTTPVGGIPEIVEHGKAGLLFQPGDINALTEALCQLLNDKALREKLGSNAYARAKKELDFEVYEDRLIKEIDDFSLTTVPRATPAKLTAKRAIKSAAARVISLRSKPVRPEINILAYHRVAADIEAAEHDAYYGLVVSTETFRKQCELLAATHEVMALEDAVEALPSRRADERPIGVITFDDGYKDNYNEAFPVLKELGLPATIFLPTGWVGKGVALAHDRLHYLLKIARERALSLDTALIRAGLDRKTAKMYSSLKDSLEVTERLVYLPHRLREKVIGEIEAEIGSPISYPDGYQLLTWPMVREMSSNKIRFGTHTVNHSVLTMEDQETIKNEVIDCKTDLENELGIPITTFAYPNGELDSHIRSVVEKAGYRTAVTTQVKANKIGDDLLALGRKSLCEESTRGVLGSYSERVARMRLGV